MRKSIGFLARNEALGQLSENNTVLMTSWFIRIWLIIIEIAPLLVKLFSRKGQYDYHLDKDLENQKLRNNEEIKRTAIDTALNIEKSKSSAINELISNNLEHERVLQSERIYKFFALREAIVSIVGRESAFEESIRLSTLILVRNWIANKRRENSESSVKITRLCIV
jgi:hypothetical protein